MFIPADVSVIIPSFNSRATIGACLASLVRQTSQPEEIIVVDSSTDGTPELVRRQFPEVKLRCVRSQTFPGPARNLGARLAHGPILAFIDADCEAAEDWVERLADGHSRGHQVFGGAVEVGNPRSLVALAGYLGEFREFLPVGAPRPMSHIPTCNISYRREVFFAAGGFPAAYYPQEDLLFNYLLGQRGIQPFFDPALRVRHFCRESLRSFLSHQHRIGRVTRSTLVRIDAPGSALARRPGLAWLTSPLLGAVKWVRTAAVFSTYFPREAYSHPSLLVFLALGSIWWARGFAAGARKGLSGIHGWSDPEEPIFTQIASAGMVKPK